MKRIALVIAGVIACTSALAQVVTVPPGLSPGDQYRLVFITRDTTTALSSDIADYDAFVTSQANQSALLVALPTTWRVIGSTAAVSAKAHTSTDDSPPGPNGVPIYRLDGVVIAYNYDDLWDGSIQNPLNVSQDGAVLFGAAWTGTDPTGVAVSGNELGAVDQTVTDGTSAGTITSWIQTGPYTAAVPQHLYVTSGVLTVPVRTPIEIDVKPGASTTCNGSIPVAVLGSAELDVSQIDPATLLYEGLSVRTKGNGGPSCSLFDANGDGYIDLVCQYQDGFTDGTLTGRLLDGTCIKGSDSVCVLR